MIDLKRVEREVNELFEKEKKIDIGQEHSNVEITVTVHRGEFMHLAELALEGKSVLGIDPIDELARMIDAIRFARRQLAGNWVMTVKNIIIKKDPVSRLDNKEAVLEIDRDNATQLFRLKKEVDSGGSTKETRGTEITFSTSFIDYIKYHEGMFYFRDTWINNEIDKQ